MNTMLLVKNDPSDESRSPAVAFSAGTDVDFLAEKLSLMMPIVINKIVQRELQKETLK